MAVLHRWTNDNLADSELFKSKVKIAESTSAGGNTKDVEIIVPLKYLSSLWRTLEMPLINCEVIIFKLVHQLVLLQILQTREDLK